MYLYVENGKMHRSGCINEKCIIVQFWKEDSLNFGKKTVWVRNYVQINRLGTLELKLEASNTYLVRDTGPYLGRGGGIELGFPYLSTFFNRHPKFSYNINI